MYINDYKRQLHWDWGFCLMFNMIYSTIVYILAHLHFFGHVLTNEIAYETTNIGCIKEARIETLKTELLCANACSENCIGFHYFGDNCRLIEKAVSPSNGSLKTEIFLKSTINTTNSKYHRLLSTVKIKTGKHYLSLTLSARWNRYRSFFKDVQCSISKSNLMTNVYWYQ